MSNFNHGEQLVATVPVAQWSIVPNLSNDPRKSGKYAIRTVAQLDENMVTINESGTFFLTDAQMIQLANQIGVANWKVLGRVAAKGDTKLTVVGEFRKAGEAYDGGVYEKDHWSVENYSIEVGENGNEMIDKTIIAVNVAEETKTREFHTASASSLRMALLTGNTKAVTGVETEEPAPTPTKGKK